MHFFRKCGRWNDKFFPRQRLPICEYKCELYYLRCTHEAEDMYADMCLNEKEIPTRLETMNEYSGKKDLKRCTNANNLFINFFVLAFTLLIYSIILL